MHPVKPTPKPIDCPAKDQLNNFLSGRIYDADQFEQIAKHIDTCQACSSFAATESDTISDPFQSLLLASGQKRNEDCFRLTAGYEIIEEIGRGGTGIVYLAKQAGLKRNVALKMLIGGLHASPAQLARLRRESESLAKLDHPNIVRVIDSGEQNGTPYIAMECIDGPTLDRALAKQLPEPQVAARLVAQLSDAIQSAHDNGITHLDLKPQNVILSTKSIQITENNTTEDLSLFSNPKLLDFGLTGFRTDEFQTATGELLGTPAYMAPEIALGKRSQYDVATDIYGLGTILYQCLTGRPPVTGANTAQILAAVTDNDIVEVKVLSKHIPIELQVICHRCLEKSPSARFSSAADLRDELNRYLNNQPIESRPTPLVKKCYKWCRRHPWTSTITALVTIFFVAALCGLIYHQAQITSQHEQTKQQRDQSLEKYSNTRKALLNILDVAERQSNSGAPGVQTVVGQQLKESVGVFEELARGDDSPQANIDLAEIYLRTASAQIANGEYEHAIELLNKANQRLTLMDDAQQRIVLQMLFGSRIKQAAAVDSMGNYEQALQLLQAIRPLAEKLYAIPNPSVEDLNSLAWYYHNVGNTQIHLQRHTQATVSYTRSIELRSIALLQKPDNIELLKLKSESQVCLGASQMGAGQDESALKSYQSAIDSLMEILARKPDDVLILNSIAIANLNRSNIFQGRSNLDEACRVCTESIIDLLPILEKEPDHWLTKHNLSMLFANRAIFLGSKPSNPDNLADWKRALEYAVDPGTRKQCVLYLLDTYQRREMFELSFELAKLEISKKVADPGFQFQLIKKCTAILDHKKENSKNDQLKQATRNLMVDEIKRLAEHNFFDTHHDHRDELLNADQFASFRNAISKSELAKLVSQ